MSKKRVLAIPSDSYGVGKFRMIDPFTYIGENFQDDIHVDIVYDLPDNDSSFDNYDIVVFHSFIHKTTHESNINRVNWLKNKGITTIMDIDDFWGVDQRHPMYLHIVKSETPKKKAELLRLVDYITTTTPLFADVIKSRLGVKNVIVFPNAVNEDEPQFKPEPTQSDLTRFGWLGGSSHLYDLELMKSGISTTYNTYRNKVQFVLCGFDLRGTVTEIDNLTGKAKNRPILPEETVWSKYEQIFTDDFTAISSDYYIFLSKYKEDGYNDVNEPYRRRWTKNINTYATNYNNFDVSLIPLTDSFFNGCKSQLKIIEAGFHKKPIIVSEVNPYLMDLKSAIDYGNYTDGNALMVSPNKNHKQWAQHMKRLIENPNMREDLGNRLYETVKDTYSLKKVSKDRVEFLKNIN